jgi:hypothetical protein
MPATATATADADTAPVENAATALLGGNPADEMPEVDLQAVATAQANEKTQESAEKQQPPPHSPAPATAPASAAARAAAPTSKPVLMDEQGRTFDPLLHETDDGHTPLLRKDGKTIKCRRVPLKEFKATSKVQIDQPDAPAVDPTPQQPEPVPVDPAKVQRMREAGAATCAGIQILIMRKTLGEHIAAADSDQAALATCWEEMFEHYGMERMHPVLGLAMVTGMITFDGMKQAETRNALTRALLWCKVKIGNLFLRMHGRQAKAAPEAQ